MKNATADLATKNTKGHKKNNFMKYESEGGCIVRDCWSFIVCFCVFCGHPAFLFSEDPKSPSADMILVLGAPGTDEYRDMFQSWADRWIAAAKRGSVQVTIIGKHAEETPTDYDRLQAALDTAKKETDKPLWLVLIGHGTFDRKTARFNLRGPDVSADDLAEWLKPLQRPVAVIDCSSSSAPFLMALSAPGRVVITATKSGGEENFSRFGEFLAKSIDDPAADLDKDDQTSLWEAYLAASRRTAEFYSADGRLLTEHALLDDNGDGQGTRADIFQGLVLKEGTETAADTDGPLAHQWHLVPSDRDAKLPAEVRKKRDALELEIIQLRQRKSKFKEDDYYQRLEELLVELARLNSSERRPSGP